MSAIKPGFFLCFSTKVYILRIVFDDMSEYFQKYLFDDIKISSNKNV